MPRAALEELERVAGLAGEPAAGPELAAALARSAEEYRSRRAEPISPLEVAVDGRTGSSVLGALGDRSTPFEGLVLERRGPEPPEAAWEYLRPFDRIELSADGAGHFERRPEPPARCQIRILLREHYLPAPRPAGAAAGGRPRLGPRPQLFVLPAFAEYVRRTGTVPFALSFAVYLPEERLRLEVDLLDAELLSDPRARHLPVAKRIARSARTGHAVDALVARGELSLPSARAFEALVESDGLSALDVAPMFGGVRELGASALDALVARRLATFDRRSGIYRARLEALVPPVRRAGPKEPPAPAGAHPRLRTSVMELLAAADSRSACPLCGHPLDPRGKAILCVECQALVGETPPTPSA